MDKGCNLCKCKPRSAGEGRSVTLKNLVRSEVRSGVRVRKKCLNHPTAAERGCCQFTEKVIKIANENLVRGEVRVKYAARTRTNGLRTSPPDCGFSGGWKRTDSFPGQTAEAKARSAAGWLLAIGDLPAIKKVCFTLDICSTFSNTRKRPKFQRSAGGM